MVSAFDPNPFVVGLEALDPDDSHDLVIRTSDGRCRIGGRDVAGGAVIYDQATENELYLDRDVQEVAPAAEFPIVTSSRRAPSCCGSSTSTASWSPDRSSRWGRSATASAVAGC